MLCTNIMEIAWIFQPKNKALILMYLVALPLTDATCDHGSEKQPVTNTNR